MTCRMLLLSLSSAALFASHVAIANPPNKAAAFMYSDVEQARGTNNGNADPGSGVSIESHNPPKTLPPTLPGTTSAIMFGVSAVDLFGIPIPNYNICHRLEATVDDNARGGHLHHDQEKSVGKLDPPNGGNSGDTGTLTVTYTAPDVSGEVFYRFGDCPGASNEFVRMIVKIEGLVPLLAGPDYELAGEDGNHSARYYGEPNFITGLQFLAALYAFEFTGSKLYYNDMSLPWGGLFEAWNRATQTFMGAAWKPPHSEHRLGINADLALVPEAHRKELKSFVKEAKINGVTLYHKTHWHLRYR